MSRIFEATISRSAINVLKNLLDNIVLWETANSTLFDAFGIKYFFSQQQEYTEFNTALTRIEDTVTETDRSEYGDFQTNENLAQSITQYLHKQKKIHPKIILEPTCGKGNFIIAALSTFHNIDSIVGVEIYKPYIWQTKFNIIEFYISHPIQQKPIIEIFHSNVFDFDFSSVIDNSAKEILVLGNPPWVTNAALSTMASKNVPQKSNFKKHNGYDAITGKGNFDIGEYITLMMFDSFQKVKGHVAFLVKNSVIKNIVFDQYQRQYHIADIEKLTIDSKKEFDVSVEAALFLCTLDSQPTSLCKEFDFYNPSEKIKEFGWVNDKFVSNIELYTHSSDIDGVCPIEWRQGIKHDLSAIMELDRINGHFVNGKIEEVSLEEDLVYGVLKSSDLKGKVISTPRKFTLITQKKVGQDTGYIKHQFPKTFRYLQSHKDSFDKRKSSIYNNKPDFSIFGIGDYSFAPYKVAISGLYKTYTFSLILPLNDKPLMLDDTCYLLGFDCLDFAAYTAILLNLEKTTKFLQSITFSDAKRTFTKDILMRIDLYSLAKQLSESELSKELTSLNTIYNLQISIEYWDEYLQSLQPETITQLDIFAFTE